MLAEKQIQYRQRFDLLAHHQSAVLLFQHLLLLAGIPAQEVTGLTEAKTTNTSNELARSGQDLGDHQKHTLPYA
ncbi:MAG: hypothetical protein ACLTSA_11375 [Faecalibacterium sp.]